MERSQGFTFLEVMISLAVLAACLVVLLKLQSRGVDSFTESLTITETLLLARTKLVETEAAGFPELGKDEGDFGEKYPGYRWVRDVSETGIDTLRKVSLTVMPPGMDDGPGTARLETFMARVESASISDLASGEGGAASGQGALPSGSEGSTSSASAEGAGTSPGLPFSGRRPDHTNAPSPQTSAPGFLPWLSTNAPRNPAPQQSGRPPAFLPWLTGGGRPQTQDK